MNKINWFIVAALVPYGVVFPISYLAMRIVFEIQTSVAYDIFGPRGFLPLWVIYILLIGCLCSIPIVKYHDWVDGNFSWNTEKKQMCYDPGLQYLKARPFDELTAKEYKTIYYLTHDSNG